ncbi:hypothetical protein F5B20DRAFT_79686 [Whalleya microplaca]|nr:hypothetical protein F5B20DRAFT_79686 [Whalleya microplaca]
MPSKISLDGGIALVTGAASGIGKETAFAFAEAGVRGVVFADVNQQGARDAAAESRSCAKNADYRPLALEVDIASQDSVQAMVDATVKEFGRIDYSVNSAGIGNISPALTPDLNVDVFSKTMDINIKGTLLCVRAVAKVMSRQEPLAYTSSRHGTRSLGRGSIVNLGSINSYMAAPGMSSYVASKHAVLGITKSAAMDCMKHHIRVNAVCPSFTDTAMMQAGFQRVRGLEQIVKTATPLRRSATTDEVADCIVFLCSPSASYINGAGLNIDSGITLTAHL